MQEKVENLDINPSYRIGNCCFTLFHYFTVSLSHTVLAWLMRGAWFKGNLCCRLRPVHWGKGRNIILQLRQFTKEAKAKKPEINDKPTSIRIAMMFTAEVVAGAWLSYLEDGFHIFLTLMIVIGMIMFGGDRENWPNYQIHMPCNLYKDLTIEGSTREAHMKVGAVISNSFLAFHTLRLCHLIGKHTIHQNSL